MFRGLMFRGLIFRDSVNCMAASAIRLYNKCGEAISISCRA